MNQLCLEWGGYKLIKRQCQPWWNSHSLHSQRSRCWNWPRWWWWQCISWDIWNVVMVDYRQPYLLGKCWRWYISLGQLVDIWWFGWYISLGNPFSSKHSFDWTGMSDYLRLLHKSVADEKYSLRQWNKCFRICLKVDLIQVLAALSAPSLPLLSVTLEFQYSLGTF